MSREEVQVQWKARVEEFRESGQTASEWCRIHSLNVNQFRRWMRKFSDSGLPKSTPSTVRWLSVEVDSAAPRSPESMIAIRIGAVHIEIQDGFNSTLLKQVVQALVE